jgi:transposase
MVGSASACRMSGDIIRTASRRSVCLARSVSDRDGVTTHAPWHRVAGGTARAASAHVTTLIARIRLVNRQLKQAHQQGDALTARLIPSDEVEPGQRKEHDVEILASFPGVGRIVLATLLAEAFDALQRRDYALRSLTGVTPVTKRSGQIGADHRRQGRHRREAHPGTPSGVVGPVGPVGAQGGLSRVGDRKTPTRQPWNRN